MLDFKTIPPLVVTDDLPKKKIDKYYKPPTPELIAYLDFSVSTTGVLSGVKVNENPFIDHLLTLLVLSFLLTNQILKTVIFNSVDVHVLWVDTVCTCTLCGCTCM